MAFQYRITLIFLILVAPLALAAGGGGGGGGSGTKNIVPSYSDLQCDDHGTLSFTRSSDLNSVVALTPSGKEITVPGSWGFSKFTSRESALSEAGTYIVKDPAFGNYKVHCPGIRLSCTWANLKVQQCTVSATNVSVTINAINISTDDLQYKFSLTGTPRTLSYKKGSISTQIKDLKVTRQNSDTYLITVANLLNASAFEVSIPDCIGRSSVYSRKECTVNGTETTSSTSQCGGYLDISDRVRCRLRLNADERKEYYNFFPEECKIRSDSQACLQTYRAVQECWDFPNGDDRINCVRRILKLGDIFAEKANCNALDSGKRENCNQELKTKGYDLIKFRFYNLEEEAEELLENGQLSEDEVTDFVVKMEQSKAAFNLAKTKEERRLIILQARQSWIELMRKVKP